MARIAGINIPDRQHAEIGLTAIFGIGRWTWAATGACVTVAACRCVVSAPRRMPARAKVLARPA